MIQHTSSNQRYVWWERHLEESLASPNRRVTGRLMGFWSKSLQSAAENYIPFQNNS